MARPPATRVSEVVEALVQRLSPYIGENMVRSSARLHCEKLGIGEGGVSPAQLETLLGRFETALRLFVGRDKAAALVGDVRSDVDGRGEAG